ncbi:MAG: hypothetical protein LBT40_17435 [Deltaproteobacteria bacterium]|nr:hypothetical protein [Deltaproteobacteria bacterium]
MPDTAIILKRPAELLPHNVQYVLVMLLSGPNRMLDLHPWNMLLFGTDEVAEWKDLADEEANVGNSEAVDFIIHLLTRRE